VRGQEFAASQQKLPSVVMILTAGAVMLQVAAKSRRNLVGQKSFRGIGRHNNSTGSRLNGGIDIQPAASASFGCDGNPGD
jgi:hypothetical protein